MGNGKPGLPWASLRIPRCYNPGILPALSTADILLALVVDMLLLGSIITLIVDVWRLRTGALDRLTWIAVFILLGMLGSMMYLAAHRALAARIAIPLQIIAWLIAVYLVETSSYF